MIIRSLRWRLVAAMALIIAAVAATSGLFTSVTVKRELNRFLTAQRREEARAVMELFRTHDVDDAMRRAHEQFGIRSIVMDGGRVVRFFPPEMSAYQVQQLPSGGIELTRNGSDGLETLRILGTSLVFRGVGKVYLLPPREKPPSDERALRFNVDRPLVFGLAAAALLAVGVMWTIFRRVFRPVEALTDGARALAAGRLDARVPVRGNDEVAELGRAFNSMAEALERNERARRSMVSDVAHELRTPLTSIRVQIEAVQDGVLTPDAKWIASIGEDAAALAHLVDDLQQLSLADAGALRLEVAEVAVDEIIERALHGLGEPGVEIVWSAAAVAAAFESGSCGCRTPCVRVDARRIVQVIRNLVVNALAYAASSVTVSVVPVDDTIEIRVADDGPGVPPEHAERIFDRFYRADPSRSRSTGGAGLGLAIARQLVELHGGSIRYEKPAFIVALPSSHLH